MKKVQNQMNYDPATNKGEFNAKPSKTIPDQSMSIAEIVRRHVQGLPQNGVRVPIYEGEEDVFPDISKMDLADQQELRTRAAEELQAIDEKHKRWEAYKKFQQERKDQAKNDQETKDQDKPSSTQTDPKK